MSEIVERAAMALFERDRAKPFYTKRIFYGDPPCEWSDLAEPVKDEFREQVRTTIAATREPTDTMIEAGQQFSTRHSEDVRRRWRAMVDALLGG